ncbi:MAG: PilZ domain-containing protein [Methyloprofundus sp.]|nr:PilZ domain-containing protein [Methyloprofundus sp.]
MITDIFFPSSFEEDSIINQRKAIRYNSSRRNKAIITLKQRLKTKRHIHVEVTNISSKGARIHSRYKFPPNAKVTLNFKIKGGDIWRVPAKIIHQYGDLEYGILFDTPQHDLIDQAMLHAKDFTMA